MKRLHGNQMHLMQQYASDEQQPCLDMKSNLFLRMKCIWNKQEVKPCLQTESKWNNGFKACLKWLSYKPAVIFYLNSRYNASRFSIEEHCISTFETNMEEPVTSGWNACWLETARGSSPVTLQMQKALDHDLCLICLDTVHTIQDSSDVGYFFFICTIWHDQLKFVV